MDKFVSYTKLSKKKKREQDRRMRAVWGEVNPVTRKTENEKAYKRNKTRRWKDEYPYGGFCDFYAIK